MTLKKNNKPETPRALEVMPEGVPGLIKDVPRWICWHYEYKGGKWTKPPISPLNGNTANFKDKNVWSDFKGASAAHQSKNIQSDGVGFVLSKDDDIVGIDIDHCFQDGEITEVTESIIKKVNSYTELSPSGEGIRIFCKGLFPFSGRKNTKLGLEIYSYDRYLTVTGHILNDQLTEIVNSQVALDWLVDKYFSDSPNTRVNQTAENQRINESEVGEYIDKLCTSDIAKKFKSLFEGNIEQYMSQSEADMALCGLLAKFTEKALLIDRIFRESALMREKWDQVHSAKGLTYGQMTINKALNNSKNYSLQKDPKYYLQNIERGDAELIRDLYQDRIIYNHYAKSWFIYSDGVWNLDEKEQTRKKVCLELNQFYNIASKNSDDKVLKIHEELGFDEVSIKHVKNKSSPEEKFRDECRKRIRSLNTRKYLSNVMELAKSYLPVTTNEFDRHPLLINLKNGTFNLDLHEFREHEPKDLISKQCPTNFDEMADCPKWKAFLLRIFQADKDLVEFIKQLVGYSFTGLADLDVLLYCHGGGANGKSTFIKTLQELGGDYIENIPVDVLLLKNRNDTDAYQLSRMKGTRMVFTDEIPGGRTLNESLVKSITGGDTINARNPYEKPFSFEPTHTMWCFGNYKLNIKGNDTGIWRRVHLIPFTYTIPEEDRRDRSDVLAEFKAELPGILNWVIEGYQSYRKNGLLIPDVVSQATQDYRYESDVLGTFLEDNCVYEDGHKCELKKFSNSYLDWCSKNKEFPAAKTSRQIGALLRSRGINVSAGTGNKRYVNGLYLTSNDFEDNCQLTSYSNDLGSQPFTEKNKRPIEEVRESR